MRKQLSGLLAAALVLSGSILGATNAFAASIENPAGPLTEIRISEDLNCNVAYLGDTHGEFFDDTACGTFVTYGGKLYGPRSNWTENEIPWTPVSQVMTGTGAPGDPYKITTQVSGGDLIVTQVDTYVIGENSYRTDVNIYNNGFSLLDAILYHGADCYLQDSDEGFGEFDSTTGAITCRGLEPNSEQPIPGSRIEQFIPLTSDSNHLYAHYSEIWDTIDAMIPLPNEVRESDWTIDNGIALSWSTQIESASQAQFAMLTNFSPLGTVALTTSLTSNLSSINIGTQATLTATITNPNVTSQSLTSATITLISGLSYVPGSASGIGEPTVSGHALIFPGPFDIAGAGGTASFTFKVTGVAASSGAVNLAGLALSGAPVIGSATTITVTGQSPAVVVPDSPIVVQGSCPAPGQPTVPSVELPVNTESIHYALEGAVVAGGTVSVIATAQPGYVFNDELDGWTLTENNSIATQKIILDEVNCPSPVALVKPTITQATCSAGPVVTLATTAGVGYTMSPARPVAGDKVVVTATAQTGFTLADTDGWVMNESGTATFTVTLDATPTDCPVTVPETGATGSMAPAGLLLSVILLGAGTFAFLRRRFI